MPKVIIIPDNQVECLCRDAVAFANTCQSDFNFYLVPQIVDNNSPLNKASSEVGDVLKYIENIKQLHNYESDDLVFTFYNGVLKASNHRPPLSNLYCAGSRYDESQPCTGVISLKYLGWNILEEKYNYEVQKHSILHLIICGIIGAYTHLTAHNDIGCLLDLNLQLTSFNLKLQKGYYLCSSHEYGCYDKIKNEKYGKAILRLCDSFKTSKEAKNVSNYFAGQIVVNQDKYEQTFIPAQAEGKKKFKLEFIHWFTIISAICGLIVLLFGNNIWGRFASKDSSEIKNDTTTVIEQKLDTIITTLELPYLENVPIIDKGLFIKYYFNGFIFGGVNIDTININGRSKTGESLSFTKLNSELRIDITKEPYVEFEYKGINYSIEISGKHYSFTCTIRKNIKPTLILKRYNRL